MGANGNPTSCVIVSKNNPSYGSIRVIQDRIVIDEQGFAKVKQVSALIQGLVKDLSRFGWKPGQEIDGNIVIQEQLKPFSTKTPERDYKIAGETGIVCCVDGQPIYRKAFYKMYSDVDTYVAHTNGDEIKAAYQEQHTKEPAQVEENADLTNA